MARMQTASLVPTLNYSVVNTRRKRHAPSYTCIILASALFSSQAKNWPITTKTIIPFKKKSNIFIIKKNTANDKFDHVYVMFVSRLYQGKRDETYTDSKVGSGKQDEGCVLGCHKQTGT